MIKTFFFIGLCLILVMSILFYIVIQKPKFEANLLGTGDNSKVVLITLDNKGYKTIKLEDVTVNNDQQPDFVKAQINNAKKGFVITDTFTDEGYVFKNIDNLNIKKNTTKQELKYDSLYGLSIKHHEKIESVNITYTYFGKSYVTSIIID